MKIEVVDIRSVGNTEGYLKAFADVKFDNKLIVKAFSVLQGRQGLFVCPPRKASKDGRFFDLLVFSDDAFKHEIETKVLEAYDKEVCNVG